MSTKTLLGLEECPLSEAEIISRIIDAQSRDIRIVEFPLKNRKVQVTLTGINPQGIIKDYQHLEDIKTK